MKGFNRGRSASSGRLALDLVPALMMGAAAGFLAAIAPVELAERLVLESRLPAILPAARPPLGMTARGLLAAAAFVAVSLGVWLALRLFGLGASRRPKEDRPRPAAAPGVRRADRHPDAPPRRPLFAQEDLNSAAPLAPATGPQPEAIADRPLPLPNPARVTAPDERAPAAPPRPATPRPAARETVAELLARLEAGMGQQRVR